MITGSQKIEAGFLCGNGQLYKFGDRKLLVGQHKANHAPVDRRSSALRSD